MGYFDQVNVVDLIQNGNWTDAKALIQKGCKTKPEVQAYRLARVCCAMLDPEGCINRPDWAERFLKMFNV